MEDKPKTIGSIYFNVKKGGDPTAGPKIQKAIDFLKQNNVYMSISIKPDGGEEYDKYTGFFNGFKDSPQKPDVVIRKSQPAQATRGGFSGKSKSYAKPNKYAQKAAPVVNNTEDFDDEVPFG